MDSNPKQNLKSEAFERFIILFSLLSSASFLWAARFSASLAACCNSSLSTRRRLSLQADSYASRLYQDRIHQFFLAAKWPYAIRAMTFGAKCWSLHGGPYWEQDPTHELCYDLYQFLWLQTQTLIIDLIYLPILVPLWPTGRMLKKRHIVADQHVSNAANSIADFPVLHYRFTEERIIRKVKTSLG